jgi:predicted DNA-binding transcriptional regulator AlpA
MHKKHPRLSLQDEPALKTGPAAGYLGIAHSTLNKLRRQGRAPAHVVVGWRKFVWPVADLDAYLAAKRVEPTASSNEGGEA